MTTRTKVKRTTGKRGRPSTSTPLKKVVKEAARGVRGAVKAGGAVGKKAAKSKQLRAGVKQLGHAALGTTGLKAIGSATKRRGSTGKPVNAKGRSTTAKTAANVRGRRRRVY